MELLLGDCLEVLRSHTDNSVDACVTDPPYGLKFMGKKWDYDVPSVEIWREVFRVLKPGAHLLSFGGTRTYHRMVCAIEDAGFEIRDQIQWIYGQGFPKSLDISKAIDKAAGIDTPQGDGRFITIDKGGKSNGGSMRRSDHPQHKKRESSTSAAKQWDGWGTALKPANEPIVLARKPISEKTVAANVLKWGTGGLNIDAARIESDGLTKGGSCKGNSALYMNKNAGIRESRPRSAEHTQGRFPANVILDEQAGELLDEQSAPKMHSAGSTRDKGLAKQAGDGALFGMGNHEGNGLRFGDTGGASRFFYCAKASKRERGEGNGHPTVKPLSLMRYLVKLITPPNGIVLDPFMGSGTTGIACKGDGFDFIGIEASSEYLEIAKRRLVC